MIRVKPVRSLSLAAALSLVGFLAYAGPVSAQEGDPERGAEVGETCIGCHGIQNLRNPFPPYRIPKLGGQHEESLYLALVEYRERRRSHPTMFAQAASYDEQDLRDVAAWLSGINGGELETGTPDSNPRVERGRELAGVCAACHGDDGVSPNAQWPHLAGQHEDYLFHAMRGYVTGERTEPVMVGLMEDFTEEEMRDLAAFYAAQPGLFTPQLSDFR